MPVRFNTDHQHAVIDAETAVAPGECHEFSEEQIEAGLTGSWSDTDPREGLADEQVFKLARDRSRAELDEQARALGVESPEDLPNRQVVAEAIQQALSEKAKSIEDVAAQAAETNPPAEPGENKE